MCPYFIQSTGMFTDVRSRFFTPLKSENVADRIVNGILREEIYVFMPSIFRYMFWMKWFSLFWVNFFVFHLTIGVFFRIVPWSIVSLYLRSIVPDAAPSPNPVNQQKTSNYKTESIKANMVNGVHNVSGNERNLWEMRKKYFIRVLEL